MRQQSLHRLALLAVAVSVVLAGCVAPSAPSTQDGYSDAQWSMYYGGGCLGDPSPNGGWLYWAASGDGYVASFNATFAGTSDVETSMSHTPTGVYTLTITPTAGETKPGAGDCEPGVTMGASVGLPRDFESFRVVYDGRVLAAAPNDGETTAELVDLPTPVNRTTTNATGQ
ncbi:hypothetical protein [Halocalculus aciditolerans]|nr:hypothetical protein [Halocalculus aciditolerans]